MTIATQHIDAFAGELLVPGDHRYDAASASFNTLVEQRPAAIAIPADERDVGAAIRYAREQGLRVAAQHTGHNAAPLGGLDDVLLLKTDAMLGAEIDVESRRARIRAGARWKHVVPRASKLGLTGLHGSSPQVGITGYTLGGGMSWYGRKYGLQSDRVIAIELVTADGELRRVDHDNEPELFWALRGGGGNFGVVTAIEFELIEMREVYAGILFYEWERTAEVFHAWHELLPGLPDELTSIARILEFPPGDAEVPDALRGGKFALVEGVWVGDRSAGDEVLRPLRELSPVLDTFEPMPPVGLGELHMDPVDPLPAVLDSLLLGKLPAKAIDEFVAAARPEPGAPVSSIELGHLGGAMARPKPGHGARANFPGLFSLFAIGVPENGITVAELEHDLGVLREAMRPYRSGEYLNFVDTEGSPERFFGPATLRRLRAVKAAYDPDGLIRANHAI